MWVRVPPAAPAKLCRKCVDIRSGGRHNEDMSNTDTAATLYRYNTAEAIRPATADELARSIEAAKHDGGAGVIEVDGESVYAQ